MIFLVWGSSLEEHDKNLNFLLETLQHNGLTLNWEKCIFRREQAIYRGQHFSADGVRPLRNRVEVVKKFKTPSTPEEVESLLGLVNYCAKHIPNFSETTFPLRKLIRKGVKFQWG
jgi:hypothetical protein